MAVGTQRKLSSTAPISASVPWVFFSSSLKTAARSILDWCPKRHSIGCARRRLDHQSSEKQCSRPQVQIQAGQRTIKMPSKILGSHKIYGVVAGNNEKPRENALQPTHIANHFPIDSVHADEYQD